MDQLHNPKPNATRNSLALSKPDTPVSNLQLSDAMVGASLAGLVRENGRGPAVMLVTMELDRVNRVCGNSMDAETVSYCAELILDRFKFRTINALRIALRDGLNSGKIYGKLTYPLIAEWLTDHETAMEAHSYQRHLGTK